ncbi:hypothetical protein [Psychrosphaera aestuarii]|uniref:hypothetical protein n=1 Tax=Psychrosphaera aestuarii TaxID=1266052 RepID=UPI001B32E7B3|nr:hypothetical protein [Psychrosphaera aestuarii]
MFKTAIGTVAAILLYTTSLPTMANSSIEEIKKRAAEITELKTLFQSADPALRLAAIDTMQNSKDLAMREMAFSAGINASDESVVALTIRNRFSELDNFIVTLLKPADGDSAIKVYNEYGGKVSFTVYEYNKGKGTIKVRTKRGSTNRYLATISGLNLFLTSAGCKGDFKLAEDLIYKGTMVCDKQQFSATLSLF